MRKAALATAASSLVLAVFGGTGAAASNAVREPVAAAAKTCGRGYTRASIGGAIKCLRRGEYCAVAYRSTYRRYGYVCLGNPARLR